MAEILKVEIPGDMKRSKPDSLEPPKVLILCQDTRTCYQLKQFLTQDGERYLLYTAMRHQIPIGKLSSTYAKLQNAATNDLSQTQKDSSQNSTRKSNKDELNDKEEHDEVSCTQMDELTQLLNAGDADDQLDAEYFQESYMLTMTQTQFDNLSMDSVLLNDSGNDSSDVSAVDNSIFEPFPEVFYENSQNN